MTIDKINSATQEDFIIFYCSNIIRNLTTQHIEGHVLFLHSVWPSIKKDHTPRCIRLINMALVVMDLPSIHIECSGGDIDR